MSNKKLIGAYLSSFIYIIFLVFVLVIISYYQFTEMDKMPWVLYIFIIVMYTIPLIGIIINLKNRVKEIKGGEEDEASKY